MVHIIEKYSMYHFHFSFISFLEQTLHISLLHNISLPYAYYDITHIFYILSQTYFSFGGMVAGDGDGKENVIASISLWNIICIKDNVEALEKIIVEDEKKTYIFTCKIYYCL